MLTDAMKMFDLEAPIFAFSHCRDVVAAVSRAGGIGTLGTTHITKRQLEIELNWLDEHTDGKPYGVDLMFASNPPKEYESLTVDDAAKYLPEEHRTFVSDLLKKHGVPEPQKADVVDSKGREPIERWRELVVHQRRQADPGQRLWPHELGDQPADHCQRPRWRLEQRRHVHRRGVEALGSLG